MPRTIAFASSLLLLLGSLFALASAWSFQLFGGFMPCTLCLMQREPYYLGVPVMLIALMAEWQRWSRWTVIAPLAVMLVAFAWGGGVGFYQAGAEWKLWPGPDCTVVEGVTLSGNAADLFSNLNDVRVPRCDEAQLRIIGLSFAGWNVVISAGLVLIAGIGIWGKWRNRPLPAGYGGPAA